MANIARAPRPPPIDVRVERTPGDPANNTCHSAPLNYSHSPASDYSPMSPTFSPTGTARFPSSNSSMASSPLAFEQLDLHSLAKRAAPALPDVQEDPFELDSSSVYTRNSFEQIDQVGASYQNSPNPADQPWSTWPGEVSSMPAATPDGDGLPDDLWEGFNSEAEAQREPSPKRRRSGVSALDSLTSRVITRFPSLTRRKSRKTHYNSRSEGNSGLSSPVGPRSRSTSRARSLSLFRRPDATDMVMDDVQGSRAADRIETINEDDVHDAGLQDLTPFHPTASSESEGQSQPIERVQTPLLPAIMDVDDPSGRAAPFRELAGTGSSIIGDSGYDSTGSIQATPQLSAKTSMSLMYTSSGPGDLCESPLAHNSTMPSPLEVEWSEKLGHANFVIRPQPYLPSSFTAATCSTLLADWEKARTEYSKHLARTSKHFGHTSKTYRLTEQKWVAIDNVWKQFYGEVRGQVAADDSTAPKSPDEPAPVVRIPSLDEKFPQLSDYEIVGAMERVSPPQRVGSQIARAPSKRNGFMKLIGLDKRARSASGPG